MNTFYQTAQQGIYDAELDFNENWIEYNADSSEIELRTLIAASVDATQEYIDAYVKRLNELVGKK